jgi:GMP synthase (glutamine-hydrolysing)
MSRAQADGLVTVLQHLPHEHAALAGELLEARGHRVRTVRLWDGQACPADPREVGALIVLGGDMDTDERDRYPFLADEVRLAGRCVEAGTPVLGICLGAELLAEATGGRVRHGVPEIGYPEIHRTDAGRTDEVLGALADGTPAFNGHHDHVEVGAGAVVLAYSDLSPVQAFRVGSALGLQFHPEADARLVSGYVRVPEVRTYLRDAGWDPGALLAEACSRDAAHRAAGARLLGRWLDVATTSGRQRCPQPRAGTT